LEPIVEESNDVFEDVPDYVERYPEPSSTIEG
jgi:hypothetical protein